MDFGAVKYCSLTAIDSLTESTSSLNITEHAKEKNIWVKVSKGGILSYLGRICKGAIHISHFVWR